MRALRSVVATLVAWRALAGAAGAVPPLDCQSCNRPDLPDHVTDFNNPFQPAVTGTINGLPYTFAGGSLANLSLDESHVPHAYGLVYRSDSSAFYGNALQRSIFMWELFEPDKLQRSASKSSLAQKDFVAIGLYHYSTSYGVSAQGTYYASSLQGCSASVSSDEKKQLGQWKVECKGTLADILTRVGMLHSHRRALVSIVLDTPLDKKPKLGGKGP